MRVALLVCALAGLARAETVRVELGVGGIESMDDSWLLLMGSSTAVVPELVVFGDVGAGLEVGGFLRGVIEGGEGSFFQASTEFDFLDIGARVRWSWRGLGWVRPFVWADVALAYTEVSLGARDTTTWGASAGGHAGVEFLSGPLLGALRIGASLSAGYLWRSAVATGPDDGTSPGDLSLHGPGYRFAITGVF